MSETPIIEARPAPTYRQCSACFYADRLTEILIGTTTHNGASTQSVCLCQTCKARLKELL